MKHKLRINKERLRKISQDYKNLNDIQLKNSRFNNFLDFIMKCLDPNEIKLIKRKFNEQFLSDSMFKTYLLDKYQKIEDSKTFECK